MPSQIPVKANRTGADVTSLGEFGATDTLANAVIAASNVTQHQTALSIAWAQLTGVPGTFPPSAHNHNAADINAGNLAYARLPNIAGSWDAGAGNLITITRSLRVSEVVGIGTAPNAMIGLWLIKTLSGGATQYGALINPTFDSDATTAGYGIRVIPATAAAAFTVTSLWGVRISDATKGSGSTITTQIALVIDTQTQGATNWQIYSIGGNSAFGGNTRFGGLTAPTEAVDITGNLRTTGTVGIGNAPLTNHGLSVRSTALVGTAQRGISSLPIFTSAATTEGAAVLAAPETAAAVFTVASIYGVRINNAVKGAGSTITTAYGLYVEGQTQGATNWSIYAVNGNVSFRNTALATTATDGHLFIPSCAGVPTGVPASIPTGQVALQYDSTNNRLYAYSGAWRMVALA